LFNVGGSCLRNIEYLNSFIAFLSNFALIKTRTGVWPRASWVTSAFLLALIIIWRDLMVKLEPGSFPSPITGAGSLVTNEHELSIMGPGVLNKDTIAESFAHRLRTGLTIKAFGDGTVKDGIGAHGWHIRPDLDLTHDLHSIESAAQTDGHQDTISSLRTESAAVLAALYLIRTICTFYDIK
jgi:hypothetical protein